MERCRPELLIRWLQFGCFTPLMHAHSKMPQEPWNYGERTMALYRGYVLLHEQLVPYVRAAAATAARTGLPIIRPLCLTDPSDSRGWTLTDAYGFGPALWVAPVLDDGAREREVSLPRGDWIETWSGDARSRRRRDERAGAAVPDPGLGPVGLDRRHVSGLARRGRSGRCRRAFAAAGRDPVGRATLGLDRGDARGRHADRLAPRALERPGDREIVFERRD